MKIAIHIATKNRKQDLLITLKNITDLSAEIVVFDDGSDDGTYEAVKNQFTQVKLLKNTQSKGYMYCRNYMLNNSDAEIAISLDDDASFLSENPIENIVDYFIQNTQCGLIAFRIFWGIQPPIHTKTDEVSTIVNSYIGCGHAWRLSAWRSIPSYPEWFEFYGEENFASLHLYHQKWQIHYLPNILIHHRVDMQARKLNIQNQHFRYRRGLRADWYNMFLFYPIGKAFYTFFYTVFVQLKNKILKGQFSLLKPLTDAIVDLIRNSIKIYQNRKGFSTSEFKEYRKLSQAKIYWKPQK